MMVWINQIIQGILLGGYYAMIACGLSFMFSVMRIINLAHGSLSIVAAFALWVIADSFGISALMAAGLALFALTLVVNFGASAIVARSRSGAESDG